MKPWTSAVACAVLLTALTKLAAPASPPKRHRPFWDVSAGPILSDNVYRDSSEQRDTGLDTRLRLGLRSRHSSRTFSQLQYDFDTLTFPEADVENRVDHAFEGLFRQRLGESFTLETRGGGRFSRYSNLPAFSSTTLGGQAALRSYLNSRTTLESGLSYESRRYGDYDLDYGGFGLFATLSRELGRRTFAEAGGAFRNDRYTERRLVQPLADVAALGDLRRDRDWWIGLRAVQDLTLVTRLEGSYQLGRVSSNGDSIAGLPGEEQLLGDYYSHRRHEVSVRLRRLLRRGSSMTLAARYRDRAYTGRLARDAEGAFVVPPALRHDRGMLVAATWDLPLPVLASRLASAHPGLRLRLSYERNHSNEALYDYSAGALSFAFTSWF